MEIENIKNVQEEQNQLKKYAEDIVRVYKSEKEKHSQLEKAHSELQKAHSNIEFLLSSIVSILIGVSVKDTVTHWNKAAENAFGKPASLVLNKRISECGLLWDWQSIYEVIFYSISSDRPVVADEVRYTRLDQKDGFLKITVNPIKDDTNSLTGFLLFGDDITEKKFLEVQLLQAQKLESIGQLAAGIAHEINTPAQYLYDNAYFLRDSFEKIMDIIKIDRKLLVESGEGKIKASCVKELGKTFKKAEISFLEEEIPRAIDQSLQGLGRITSIVKSMKSFSHPGTDSKVLQNINRLLEDTINISKNEWKYVADIETQFEMSLPQILCYPAELNQVFLNIVINAAQAIEETGKCGKGSIKISTKKENAFVEIKISDTGKGIPENIRNRVFDPFFTTKEVGKGTGQGLSISHTIIVKKHGGSINFVSEIDKGTTFFIRLPLE